MPDFSDVKAKDLLSTEYVSVDASDSISNLLTRLKKSNDMNALVFNKTELLGVASEQGFLRNVNVSKTNVRSILRTCPKITPAHRLLDIARLMRDADVRIIPVVEKGRVSGVVRAQAMLSRLKDHALFKSLTAKDLSTPNPISIKESESVGKALTLMKESNVRKLPVWDDAGKRITGIVTWENLAINFQLALDKGLDDAYKMAKGGQMLRKDAAFNVRVGSMMDADVVSVTPSEKAFKVVEKLSKQLNPIVVLIDNGNPGIITAQSIFSALQAAQSSAEEEAQPITFTHLPDIDEVDKGNVESMISRTFTRSVKKMKGDWQLHAIFKQSKKSGLRAKTEVHLHLNGPGKNIIAQASDWKVLRATKEACDTLEKEVQKRSERR